MSLKTVVVTGGSYVSDYSFKDCQYIERIILPDSTETIGIGAFSGCKALSYLEMPLALTGNDEVDFVEIFYTLETEVDGEIVKENVSEIVSTKSLYYLFDREIPISLREVVLSNGLSEEYLELAPRAFVGSSVRIVTLKGFSGISDYAFDGVRTLSSLDVSASFQRQWQYPFCPFWQ